MSGIDEAKRLSEIIKTTDDPQAKLAAREALWTMMEEGLKPVEEFSPPELGTLMHKLYASMREDLFDDSNTPVNMLLRALDRVKMIVEYDDSPVQVAITEFQGAVQMFSAYVSWREENEPGEADSIH